jgi:hypothetical protein
MLQKFKITSYAFTVFCAVFMTLPVNTSAQNEGRGVVGRDESRAVDLEAADDFVASHYHAWEFEAIEKMSETIAELESKLAAIEDDLEKQKVARAEDKNKGSDDLRELRVDLTRILRHPRTGHLSMEEHASAGSHTYAMKAHEHMKHSFTDTTWMRGSAVRGLCQDGRVYVSVDKCSGGAEVLLFSCVEVSDERERAKGECE